MDGVWFDTAANGFGFVGVALYLGSYAALQLGIVRGASYLYATLNLLAASFVLISLMQQFNLYSAIIQLVWIGVSIVGIVRLFLIAHTTRFTEEETTFLTSKLPDLEKHEAKTLMRHAVWLDGAEGEAMMLEGQPVPHLVYLISGEARILRGGELIATTGPDTLLGEATALDGSLATATVVLAKRSRYMRIDATKLRSLAKRPALGQALLQTCIGDMRVKLETGNDRLRDMIASSDPKAAATRSAPSKRSEAS